MIEDLLCEMDKPYRALKLTLIFLSDFIQENIVSEFDMSEREKNQNILALSYILNLINEDLKRLKNEYDEKVTQKYHL